MSNTYENRYSTMPFTFEHFEFGNELLASIQGQTSRLRGSDSLAQINQAINSGSDVIDMETQQTAYEMMTNSTTSPGATGEILPAGISDYLPTVPNFLPSFGLTENIKSIVYAGAGISILVIGLAALIFSTNTAQSALKDAAKAAAVA